MGSNMIRYCSIIPTEASTDGYKSTKIAPRPKRTKAEIEKEFNEVQEQVTAAHETLDPKVEEVRKVRETETRAAVEDFRWTL